MRATKWGREAAATIWSLGHPDTYRFLLERRGWSPRRYRRWLADGLSAALLHHP